MAAAKKAAAAPATAEKEKRPSLTCASLGEVGKIRKAEDIVAAMVKLADVNFSSNTDGVPLPSKMQITKAMAVIEMKIKSKGKEAMSMRKEVKAIQATEKEEKDRKEREEREERERLAREEQERVEKLESEHDGRVKERDESVTKLKGELSTTFETQKATHVDARESEVTS